MSRKRRRSRRFQSAGFPTWSSWTTEPMQRTASWLLLAAIGLCVLPLHAATLTIGVLSQADDERLDSRRVELAYIGHPGGAPAQAVEVAIKESQFELDAADLKVKIEAATARDATDARA